MAMKIITGLRQGTPEWHNHRAKYRNASDAPAMMGCSPYKSRSQLIKERATGIFPEVDQFQQKAFDDGHRAEWLARPLAERKLDDDLSPIVAVNGTLSASLDGIVFDQTIPWEHKLLSSRLREAMFDGCTGADLPRDYQIQMEQQLAVTDKGEKVLFTASEWVRHRFDLPETDRNAWRLVEARHCWYYPNLQLRAEIMAGWELLDKEVAEYTPEAATPVKLMGNKPEALPALTITLSGSVEKSNLPEFKAAAVARIESIKTELVTDQDFADAEQAVKWCTDAASRLVAAKDHALGQAEAVNLLFTTLDDLIEMIDQKRLTLEKLIKSEKELRKTALVTEHQQKLDEHVNKLNEDLGAQYLMRPAGHFAPASKNLRSIDSMRNKLAEKLAAMVAEADLAAQRFKENRQYLKQDGADWITLFPDFGVVGAKAAEDFKAVAQLRINDQKQAEQKRAEALAEAERERIRAEEAAKAAAEAATKAAIEARERAINAAEADVLRAADAAEQAEKRRKAEQDLKLKDAVDLLRVQQSDQLTLSQPRETAAPPAAPANKAEWEALVESGETMTLGSINAALGFVKVDASSLAALGLPTHKERGANHLPTSHFPVLCNGLIDHITDVRDSFKS